MIQETTDMDLELEDQMVVEDIMESHGYEEPNETQQYAFRNGALEEGNKLLTANTGNGKTLVAESRALKTLDQGGNVGYLVPSQRLVGDKYSEIKEWCKEYKVGKRGGWRENDVTVTTFESYYTALMNRIDGVRKLDLVILDDFHEIYGDFRGPEIEKAVSASLEQNTRIFAMSATVGNAEEIADWLDADAIQDPQGRGIEIEEKMYERWDGSKKRQIAHVIEKHSDKAPFLVFNYAKSYCESRAEAISEVTDFSSPDIDVVEEFRDVYGGELPEELENLAVLCENGVAYYHSDLNGRIQRVISELYKEKEIKCICSTTSLAHGFDAPVRSVVVADLKRGPEWIAVHEYQQMVGRAARPSWGYEKGYAYSISSSPEEAREKYHKPRELEDIENHIGKDSVLPMTALELMKMGYTEIEELQKFFKNTLYYVQKTREKDAAVRDRVYSTIKRDLEDGYGMVEEESDFEFQVVDHETGEEETVRKSSGDETFTVTDKGRATVDFNYETFVDTEIDEIDKYFDSIADIEEPSKLDVLEAASDSFNLNVVDSTDVKPALEEKMDDAGLNIDLEGETMKRCSHVTAAVVKWFWLGNVAVDEIDDRVGVDISYPRRTIENLGKIIAATPKLYTGIYETKPSWLVPFGIQVKKGLRDDEMWLAREIDDFGRYRVRQVRHYFQETLPAFDSHTPLKKCLEEFYIEKCGCEEAKLEDVLKNKIDGVGHKLAPKIAAKVDEVVEKDSEDDDTFYGLSIDEEIVDSAKSVEEVESESASLASF